MTLPASAIRLGTAATDRGTAGTQEPWRCTWLAKPILTVGRFLDSEGKRTAEQRGDPFAHECASHAGPSPPGPQETGAGQTPLPSSPFPPRLFQPTLTHFALLPSMAWGSKQHLDLIKRLPSPTKRPKSNLCYLVSNLCCLVSPSAVDGGGSSNPGAAAGLKGSRMLQQPTRTGSLKMGPAG